MYDKYVAAAKDANTTGDRVAFEHNMQYADHFIRILNERFSQERPDSNNMPQQSAVPPAGEASASGSETSEQQESESSQIGNDQCAQSAAKTRRLKQQPIA